MSSERARPDSLTAGLRQLVAELEAHIDTRGWDRPASLWSLDALDMDQTATTVGDGLVVGFSLSLIAELDGHPFDALVGRHDEHALGVALASEGWNYSAATLARIAGGADVPYPPSADPERREVRFLSLLLRDGTMVSAFRQRDEHEVALIEEPAEGRVLTAMRRYLGQPSKATWQDEAGTVIARSWITLASIAVSVIGAPHADNATTLVDTMLEGPPGVLFDALPDIGDELVVALGPQTSARSLLDAIRRGRGPGWAELQRAGAAGGSVFAQWADSALYAGELETRLPGRRAAEAALDDLRLAGVAPDLLRWLQRALRPAH